VVVRAAAVNLDSVESVSLGVLVERLGRLSHDRMVEVCAALEVAVDCGR
jgi:mRNA interferase MazF